MKFQISGRTYIAGWQHVAEDDGSRSTVCVVEELLQDGVRLGVSSGTAKCNPSDVYNRNKGRKLSLHRAITQTVPMVQNGINVAWSQLFNIDDRRAIWQAYHDMRGKW